MKSILRPFALSCLIAAGAAATSAWAIDYRHLLPVVNVEADSISEVPVSPLDSVMNVMVTENVILRLTEDDFRMAAEELGIDVPAIKAVVEIEAGKSHNGFSAPGRPIINFDVSMFKRFASRSGVNIAKYAKSHPVVFQSPQIRKYGSQQAAQHARLEAAYTIDRKSAIQGTFWGMFQIGGFNWKKCGASSMDEFVELMSSSEHNQLELFVRFIENSGLAQHLRAKDWASFARGYNGPSYARRGYHTRLANAYARYKAMDKEKGLDKDKKNSNGSAQSKNAEQIESTR